MEKTEEVAPTEHKNGTIIGEVVLGKIDPKTLTEKEFNKSEELLYHGAFKEFIYSRTGDYDWRANTFGDTWADYGEGFYTTDKLDQAKNYSRERKKYDEKRKHEEPLVYSFLPFKARMLDVRDRNNPEGLGVLPTTFVEGWIKYLEKYLLEEKNFANIDPPRGAELIKRGIKENFLDRVEAALRENQDITIRGGFRDYGIFLPNMNGLIEQPSRNFMLSRGYDGMIYREGGEGEKREGLTGYVFYNYQVIDTWEGWQKRK